ncbi:uncharacterized protein Z518_10365 [Rhinocladiella mackenziei CBS 650.93]|uniref:Eisosome protein 1 n=1 Tax=Rhinocladiella mackenziei CBS 650.93 TaxID=1442369 RepID=A0A0D2IAF3_9EURO|nr:uncharacterized protein Z518_10365 [Rhinocladiella mackenziei CBS 650.93]KIX00226.1 hypothetical protein Z518_10365 [Rhinocladiella mackenziei CBS 650.93]
MSAITANPHSSYTPSDRLEDQAASAALYVVRDTPSKQSTSSILDEDGRLSSASAALSLKYARARDLPSFPSAGGVKLASAGAAASLAAESNKKPFEHWKPGAIPAASHAANKAKDYEMDPMWKPELSQVGSQAAAAAHKDAAPVEIWKAPDTEHGASAAWSALQNQKSPPAIAERHVSTDGRQKALLAATASLSAGRRRAESAPIRPSPQTHPGTGIGGSAWALKAAESSHRGHISSSPSRAPTDGSNLSGADVAKVQNMARNNVSRQMYSSNPPVSIEVEEKKRQEMLRASAVAMARKMFVIQQEQFDEAKGIRRSESHYAAYTARRRAQSDVMNKTASKEEVPPRYENLEETARRLAQDRLAKLQDEHAEYRQYYGQQTPPQRSRLTLRRGRRTLSLQDHDESDEEQSRKIRTQMSFFQSKLAEVDSKKRQADRDALLAIAHKNVTARMNAMDEKVFSETGKTSPQQRELWERQARERAQRESDDRLINAGKVHVGGGKYLEQSEVDAIAKARLQPTLDEITEKAEQQRARDEELKLELERQKAEAEAEKQRQAEIKAEQKAAADRERAEVKAQRAEEKRALQDQKHEERRLRTEQRATEKRARDEANAAEKERQRVEREEKRPSGAGKSRLLPSFLSRGAIGAGAATAAVVEGTADAAGGGARAVAGAAPAPGTTMAAQADEPAGETAHDRVTSDPPEAAHALAADEEDEAAGPKEESRPSPPTAERDVGPEDNVAASPYSSIAQPQEAASPTSPVSPSKRDSKMKAWFKKFRTGSKAENDLGEKPTVAETEPETTAAPATTKPIEPVEEDRPTSDSIRDVALAGRSDNETDDMYGTSPKPAGRVSPVHDEPPSTDPVPSSVAVEPDHRPRSISSLSDSTDLSEERYVIAADVASSKYSAEHGSKRDSGVDQAAALSDTDSEPRGRKGFRERFLKKVIPGRDKDKHKSVAEPASTPAAAPIAKEPSQAIPAKPIETEPATTTETSRNEPASNRGLEARSDAETKPTRERVQEPSTTSTEAGNTTATGATTPALTHAQTNDEEFEEARDTFDEERLGRPHQLGDVSGAKMETSRLVEVGSPITKRGSSPVGSRNSTGAGREGSRFTEEL